MDELRKAKCCACEQPMTSSQHINMCALDYKPTWEYPKLGNVLYDMPEQASAVLCDTCIDNFKTETVIKFAIELAGQKIIYHPIETLEKFGTRVCDKCDKEKSITNFWVEGQYCLTCLNEE